MIDDAPYPFRQGRKIGATIALGSRQGAGHQKSLCTTRIQEKLSPAPCAKAMLQKRTSSRQNCTKH
eukprot:scaffold159484_cov31-Tisochrysis_lutea.AAC.3